MPDRTMKIKTPLGDDVLLFNTLTATEELGRLARYDIMVLSEKNSIDPDKLLGEHVTVTLELPDGGKRYFDGHVVRFSLAGKLGRYFRYHIVARPWLWFLTRTSDNCIFQNLKVHEILQKIFDKYKVKAVSDKLLSKGDYRTREYCVQYRETDFNFVSRLMEEEGIYYFIKHSDGKHEVVLANAPGSHSASAACGTLPFVDPDRAVREDKDHISTWTFAREIQTGAYVLEDYNFETPSVDLQAKKTEKRATKESSYEFYDYANHFLVEAEGNHYAQMRLEEVQTQYELAEAATNARGLCFGELFKMTGHPRSEQNREYLVLAMSQHLEYSDYESLGQSPTNYTCTFTALSSKETFRARCLTPKPTVQGVQPAIVVGAAGDEICTDSYGRVKVQFYWDRKGKKDDKSSCFIRVSHPWAGKNFGMIHTPRVGQEVVVDFVEGDPDRPIITGRVYNAEQMPPWTLPANMTQSGILTRSSKGGSPANANALRFEDLKGSEEVWLHAEKDQRIEVEHNESHWVGNDRVKNIDHDETVHVKHDRTETVDNNETITVHGMRTETVDKNETITIHQNKTVKVDLDHEEKVLGSQSINVGKNLNEVVGINYSETVGAAMELSVGGAMAVSVGAALAESVGGAKSESVGASKSESIGESKSVDIGKNYSETTGENWELTVGKDSSTKISGKQRTEITQESSLQAKKVEISAEDEISLKAGDAEIVLKKNGDITLKGNKITIKGDGDIVIKGSNILEN
jgi:type VI secretion system secreted protein VgrG